MPQTNVISLNTTSFDKFSKRLYQEIQKESELSLAKTKEIASKSLGYRNYNGLRDYLSLPLLNTMNKDVLLSLPQGYISKDGYMTMGNVQMTTNNHFLKRFTNENIISVASILIQVDDMWGQRTLILLKTVLSLLDILGREKNADNIRQYVTFDQLFDFYKTTDNEKAKALILNYCNTMLPGFDKDSSRQTTAAEQNSYLSNQLIIVIELFKQIENQDFVMLSLDWLTRNQNETVTMEILKSLDSYSISETRFMNAYREEVVDGKTIEGIVCSKRKERKIYQINFKKQILKSEAYNDSWLCDEAFKSIIVTKLMSFKYEKFYFSDFIYNVSKIINTEKKKQYIQLLKNMMNNYESCVEYSKELSNLSKE